MSLDPSTFGATGLPPSSNITNMNQQAQDMIRASIAGYGVTPDPQISTESMMTGASPGLSYALAQGNPAFRHTLLSQPIGQSQFSSIGAPPPTALYNDPYKYDAKQHAEALKSIPDTLNTFKSMGELPIANYGWYTSVLKGDKNTVKRWQQYLSNNGFYNTYDRNGKATGKGEVNGYNTKQFQDAMQQWALAYFLPQALFSRDPQEITNARQFLSMLDVDTDSIAKTMSYNPAEREKVIDGWLQAQGPNANKVKALNLFADQFGAEALPEKLDKLRGDGVFGGIGDFLHHFIPFIGSDDEQKLKDLTPAEKELLAPSLQQAHDQSPFIKFLGDVFTAPSKALVTTALFFGNAAHGDVENPFDDQSKIRQNADSFVNNPMASIFGQQFVKDHPWVAIVGNIAVGILDDPLTYIPFVGEVNIAEKIGKGASEGIKGFETMTKAQQRKALVETGRLTKTEAFTHGLVSHRVGSLRYSAIAPRTVIKALKDKDAGLITSKLLNPVETAQTEIAKALTTKNLNQAMVRNMLNLHSDKDFDKVEKILELGQSGAEGAHMDVLNYLRDPKNHLADRLYSMDMLVHRHQYDKILKDMANWQPDKALPMAHMLRMNDAGALLLTDQPKTTLNALQDLSMAAGVDPETFKQFANDFWKTQDSAARLKLSNELLDGIKTTWDKNLKAAGKGQSLDDYMKFRESLHNSSRTVDGQPIFGIEHHPGKPGDETSFKTAVKFDKDSENYTAVQLNEMMASLEAGRDTLVAKAHGIAKAAAESLGSEAALKDPHTLEQVTALGEAAHGIQKHIDELIANNGGGTVTKTAIPMHSTQSALYLHLPFTPTEMVAYMNPVVRQAEAFQRRWGIDKAMNMWKMVTLGKPSTSMRIILGDESSRGQIHLLLNDPREWVRYMHNVLTHKGYDPREFMTQHPELVKTAHVLNQLGAGQGKFIGMVAGERRYRQNLINLMEQHYGKEEWPQVWAKAVEKPLLEGGDWEKAGQDALKEFFASDHPEAVFARGVAKVANFPGSKMVDELAVTRHNDLRSLTHPDPSDPDRMHMFNWIKDRKVDRKKLKELEKRVIGTTDDTYVLPRIQGLPPMTGGNPIGNYYSWYHEMIADRVAHARGRVFGAKYNVEHKRLSKFYANEVKEGRLSPEDISRMADSVAATWVEKNTYQGSRSVLGSTLRTIAPFWGATANSNKFYLHNLMEHPEAIPAFAKGEQAITQEQENGGLRVHLNFLSHFGMAAGDQFSFEPFNALFLTREGFGGLLPGAGPVFNVALGALPANIKDAIGENVPGMEYAANDSPIASWATNLISAAGLAMGKNGFEAPFAGRPAGYFDKQIDQKLQQMEATWQEGGRKGPAPTLQDAKNELAKTQVLSGVLGFAAPLGAATDDVRATAIRDAEENWSPGLGEEDKKKFYAEHPEVADFFKYIDPHTPETPVDKRESKGDILSRSPWVLAYTTGKGETAIPGRATSADTDRQYRRDVQAGNIRTLTPTEYITKMRQQEQMNQAWNSYDQVQNEYQDFLLASGVSTDSAEAKAWRKANYDWRIQGLVKEFPEWGDTFVKQTSQSAVGKQYASQPFYSVSTFNVIPRNPALETKTTALWRAALVRRDQAVNALYQVMASSGSTHEKEMILQGLTQELDQLAAQDPTFKAQISRFRYSSLDDLINFQAGQTLDTARGYPTA